MDPSCRRKTVSFAIDTVGDVKLSELLWTPVGDVKLYVLPWTQLETVCFAVYSVRDVKQSGLALTHLET